jgi:hypothetical protein
MDGFIATLYVCQTVFVIDISRPIWNRVGISPLIQHTTFGIDFAITKVTGQLKERSDGDVAKHRGGVL